MKKIKVDIPFLVSVLILVILGFLIFSSASLGLLSKQAVKYSNVAFNQTFLGLFLGSLACIFTSGFDYRNYRKYSLIILILSAIVTLLVFVPGIGFEHGGASRWIKIGTLSFQPSEFLKIGFILFFAAWIAKVKDKISTTKYGLIPFVAIVGVCGAILLEQPDTDTFVIIAVAGLAMFLTGGGSWRHVILLCLVGAVFVSFLVYSRPYVRTRLNTFINPQSNSLGSGYQIQQSLIAIGSGGMFGRGFGQSIQKFNVLPEPIGDSIFAVAGEEFGFSGTLGLVILFVFFCIRGLKIAGQVPDTFGRLLIVGIVIMIISQAFVNMGAMVGILPLSGITLPFVSHGGTALFMTMAEAGIVLNISKNRKR